MKIVIYFIQNLVALKHRGMYVRVFKDWNKWNYIYYFLLFVFVNVPDW